MSLYRSLKSRVRSLERQLAPDDDDQADNIDPHVRAAMEKAGNAWLKAHKLKETPDPMPSEMAEVIIDAGLAAVEST